LNTVINKYNPNHLVKNKHKFAVNYIVASVPMILLFDWLFNLSIINLQIGLILKALSIVFFCHLLITKKYKIKGFKFKNAIIYFIFLNFIYSLFSDNIVENIYYTIRVSYWVLGTLVFYYLYSNAYFNTAALRKMIMSTVLIASVFTIRLMINSDDHQNASAYLILWCLPILLNFKQSFITKVLILFALVSIIITIKRGALLALVISLFAFFIGVLKISRVLITKIRIIGIGLILISFIALIFSSIWDRLSIRLEDTSGSGRDKLYQGLIDKYTNGELHELIFGFGINSVQQYSKVLYGNYDKYSSGVAAHSDWFQYMFDFGVFGIIFMIILHYHFLKLLFLNFKNKTAILPIVSMGYVIFSFTTAYSFILNTPDAMFFGIVISVITAESIKIQSLKKYA